MGKILEKQLTFRDHCLYSNERAQKYICISTNKPQIKLEHTKQKTYFHMYFSINVALCREDLTESHIKYIQIIQNELLKLIYNVP